MKKLIILAFTLISINAIAGTNYGKKIEKLFIKKINRSIKLIDKNTEDPKWIINSIKVIRSSISYYDGILDHCIKEVPGFVDLYNNYIKKSNDWIKKNNDRNAILRKKTLEAIKLQKQVQNRLTDLKKQQDTKQKELWAKQRKLEAQKKAEEQEKFRLQEEAKKRNEETKKLKFEKEIELLAAKNGCSKIYSHQFAHFLDNVLTNGININTEKNTLFKPGSGNKYFKSFQNGKDFTLYMFKKTGVYSHPVIAVQTDGLTIDNTSLINKSLILIGTLSYNRAIGGVNVVPFLKIAE